MGHRTPAPQRTPWSVVLAAALLLSCPPPARGQAPRFTIRQDPQAAWLGGDVTFALELLPSGIVSCAWYRAPTASLQFEIFTYFKEPDLGQQNGPAYTERETGAANCSMRISPLRLNDTGAYTVAVRHPTITTASINLTVYVPLTQPAVTPDNVTVTENDTVTLTCRSPFGTETGAWLRDGAVVSAGGRLSLSPDNRTLTVRPVQRGDAGAYACQVSNAISTNRSDNATVTVAYGPDAVTVTPPGPLDLPAGSLLTLTCTAAAVPAPLFTWFFGETRHPGASWVLDRLSVAHAGGYVCQALNPHSGHGRNSSRLELRVWELLTQPAVTPDNVTVTENDTITLTCRSPPGTETVAWLRDGAVVSAGGRLSLSPDNRTLTVRPVQRRDAGAYACQVSNAISTNRSDNATVTVAYGPDAVTVTPPGPLDLPAGSLLTLTCTAAAVPAPLFTWFFGETRHPGASWVLDRLSVAHAGGYVCQALNPHSGHGRNSSRLELRVWELLTQPAVTPDNVTVTENDTITLTCRSPPGTETVAWLRDGAVVSAGGRLSLSPDNRTLTVRPVQRRDAGAYACQVSNAISTNRSDNATVTVAYGPDAVTVTPPGPLDLPAGSLLTLTCTAAAVPAPLFTWFFGETRHPGASWVLDRLSVAHAGGYVCQALNPHSGHGRNSSRLKLRVWELLTQPAVTPDNVTVTENDTVTLTCRSPPGTETVAWLRDGAVVSAGGRLSLSPDNRTLTVRPVQRGDAGAYACQVSNAISTNRSDDVNVTILYGPDGVTITPPGPLRLRLGSRLDLRCTAAAVPSPLFAWARGNASLATGSCLRLEFGDPGQAGEYRCRATNPILGRAAEAAVLLLQDEGLSSGAIAGIVLGTLLGLGLLGAAGYLLWHRVGRSSAPISVNGAKPSASSREAPATDGIDGTEEVKYSTLTFSTPGGPAPHGPPRLDSGTVYSEVRRK